ncbi:hypothetical protein KUTeg_012678, partial [Tegillarca granosa]
MKRSLRNQRTLPPVPEHASDIDIPDEYKQTTGENPVNFLLYDNGVGNANRILVFEAEGNLRLLSESSTIYMDGDIFYGSLQFSQLYTMHVPFLDTTVTVFYASVFGRDVSTKDCFYHLTQTTWRKIQSLGLANSYHESEDVHGLQHLRNIMPQDPPELRVLFDYFDKTYVNGHFRQQ